MSINALCLSHTPLMFRVEPPGDTRAALAAVLDARRAALRALAPELVVVFAPDHFNGLFYDLMPPFVIGVRAHSVGDWGNPSGPLPVDEAAARRLHEAALAAGVDLAVSWRLAVDHGVTQPLGLLFGGLDGVPVVPLLINCAAPPLPSFRRVWALGRAIGSALVADGRRVLVIGSGGLSHDPPVPQIDGATPEVSEFLIAGRSPTPEARRAREERVLAAARLAGTPEFPGRRLNPEWDRSFLECLAAGDATAFEPLERAGDAAITEAAGRGGHEVRTWVAALAARSAAGDYRLAVDWYRPVEEWIAGFAVAHADAA